MYDNKLIEQDYSKNYEYTKIKKYDSSEKAISCSSNINSNEIDNNINNMTAIYD